MNDGVFSFAFIADSQIGMDRASGGRPGSDKERLDRAIAYVNGSGVDFVVFGGDQIENPGDEHTDLQLDVLQESLSALSVPYYGVVGNHEQGDPLKNWKYIERGLPVRFSLSHRNTFVLGINAWWLRGEFGDRYSQKELDYLKTQLSQVSPDCSHRFVVMHWPLFNYHPLEEDTYWNMSNRNTLIDLFKRYEVSCVLSGHWHQDIDARWHGISLVTSVGTSGSLQYPEELSFKIVTVFEDGWSVRRVAVGSS